MEGAYLLIYTVWQLDKCFISNCMAESVYLCRLIWRYFLEITYSFCSEPIRLRLRLNCGTLFPFLFSICDELCLNPERKSFNKQMIPQSSIPVLSCNSTPYLKKLINKFCIQRKILAMPEIKEQSSSEVKQPKTRRKTVTFIEETTFSQFLELCLGVRKIVFTRYYGNNHSLCIFIAVTSENHNHL